MDAALQVYTNLTKERTVKKGLLTRSVNKLRTVVSGADTQADTVDSARRRARQFLDDLDTINVRMETILIENELAYEKDEHEELIATHRLQDVEKNVAELSEREAEVDTLQAEWRRTQQKETPGENITNADVSSKTLEALTIITDRLTSQKSPSIRTTGMSPPKWDGHFKNFYSWRQQFEQFLKSAAINNDVDKLMYVLHASVLPPRVTATIESCTTMSGTNGVWERLQEKIPKSAVIREIIAEMESIRPIRQKSASEVRAVLDRLTDFAHRVTEVGKQSELESPTVVHIVSSKLQPELYYEYERWMRHDFPSEELSVTRIVEFLRMETEAHERLTTPKVNRQEQPRRSSVNHAADAGPRRGDPQRTSNAMVYSDPCSLGCGVYHKYIDCNIFREQQPWQRRDAIKAAGRCFSCFGRHRITDCTKPRQCSDCGGRHHRMLNCFTSRSSGDTHANSSPSTQNTTTMNPTSTSFTPRTTTPNTSSGFLGHIVGHHEKHSYSPNTYVEICDVKGEWHQMVAFLDSGSDTTLIKSTTAHRLGLDGTKELFRYGVAGGGSKEEMSTRYTLQVRPIHIREGSVYTMEAMSIKRPAHDSPSIGETIFEEFPYLQPVRGCLPLAGASIDLLVGYDNAYLISALHTFTAPTKSEEHPNAAFTRLGWIIFGGMIPRPRAITAIHHMQRVSEDNMRALYYSDVVGVKPTTACICNDKELAEAKFMKHARATTEITEEGRVRVSMPWRDGYPEALPFNKEKTVSRMYSQERALKRKGRIDEYNKEIQALLTQGFVRPLTASEANDRRGWYLEHHAVYREDKSSSKVRIVWNAAAQFQGVSLNDGFHKGPDLLNSLISCLLAWRRDRVALVGDVRKMFNQIEIAASDQIYHRFVWRFGDENSPPTAYQWIRLPFGDRPAPDIATNSVRILADMSRHTEPIGSHIVHHEMYMDDIGHSTSTAEAAIRAKVEVDKVLARGCFETKTWNSNHHAVDCTPDETVIDVLGHRWDKDRDIFALKSRDLQLEPGPVTKRNILGLVAKLWDPMGILSPVSVAFRIDLQDLWHRGVTWDQPLENKDNERWHAHLDQMQELVKLELPRCLKPEDAVGQPQLHCFSDGGASGYGAVIWLRWTLIDGTTTVIFVMAKALVSPLKKKSIPQLELIAAVVMTRLAKFIEDSMGGGIKSKYFWIDSQTVLTWIRSESANFKPFVSARIQEIQDTHPRFMEEFRYVPSHMNAADALTKPLSIPELLTWREGPKFLHLPEEMWPQDSLEHNSEVDAETLKEGRVEKKPRRLRHLHHIHATEMADEERLVANVSDWDRLTRHIARWRRILQTKADRPITRTLGAEELKRAKLALFFLCQAEMREDMDKCRLTYASIAPVFDANGMIRAEGRLSKLPLSPEVRNPIILPGNSPLVELYARRQHSRYLHQGYRVVLANIAKEGIHIGNGKQLLKSIASRCIYCRTRRETLLQQKMGVLPAFRGSPNTPPFNAVTVDFFGPLKTKINRNTTTESNVMIVTCTTTRVIHLELTSTASTESFLLAWRRFVSVRGIHPTHVFSDQGKNFQGAQQPLRDMTRIKTELAAGQTDFSWEFNVPKASHMNGVVESLIRSCRKALDASVNYLNRRFSFEEWQTFLAEVTYVVNSRPLFPDGPDPVGSPAVTGNDILHPFDQPTNPQPVVEDRPHPRDVMKALHQRVQMFWETWLRYMPPHLITRSKWFHPRENLQVGDLVLLLEPGMKGGVAPRALWERALVTDVRPGEDGLVRKATVRTASTRHYDRPIHKMCLIATRDELQHGLIR